MVDKLVDKYKNLTIILILISLISIASSYLFFTVAEDYKNQIASSVETSRILINKTNIWIDEKLENEKRLNTNIIKLENRIFQQERAFKFQAEAAFTAGIVKKHINRKKKSKKKIKK